MHVWEGAMKVSRGLNIEQFDDLEDRKFEDLKDRKYKDLKSPC